MNTRTIRTIFSLALLLVVRIIRLQRGSPLPNVDQRTAGKYAGADRRPAAFGRVVYNDHYEGGFS